MEELVKLEEERGNLAYLPESKGVKNGRERESSGDYRADDCGDGGEYRGGGGVL